MSELPHRVRRAAENLAERLEHLEPPIPSAADRLREVARGIDTDLERGVLEVLVDGPSSADGRRFLNEVIGSDLFPVEADPPDDARILVRHGDEPNYRARLRDGRTIAFDEALPDRDPSFDKAIVRAEREREAARSELAERKARLEEAKASRPPPPRPPAPPPPPRPPPPSSPGIDESGDNTGMTVTRAALHASIFRRAYLTLRLLVHAILVFLRLRTRRPLPPPSERPADPPPDEPPPLRQISEAAMREAREALEVAKASERVERASGQMLHLHEERARYAEERRREFERDVRSFSDRRGRGRDLAELAIDVPCTHLPTSFALLESGPSGRGKIAGCAFIAGKEAEPTISRSALHPIVPRIVRGVRGLGPHLDRARAEWPVVVAARGAGEVLVQVEDARERVGLLEAASKKRVAEIESQRVPPPEAFRRSIVEAMGPEIASSAQDLEARAFSLLRGGVAEIRAEWTAAIDSGPDRAAVKGCLEQIQAEASPRFDRMLEAIGAGVLAEMQRVSETLQAHALDMVRAQYRTRTAHDDQLAAVFVEVPNELATLAGAPLASALAVFEKRRVEMGLGGAAAGAMLGTAIFPGIGTAIGAIVGVLAGFIEGTSSLKEVAKAKAIAHIEDIEKQIAARFTKSAEQFAGDIRYSVEEMLDLALAKRADAIARAIEIETKLLATERAKLDRISELARVLETSEHELAALTQEAMRTLRGEVEVPLPRD